MDNGFVQYSRDHTFIVSDCGIIWNGRGKRVKVIKTESGDDIVLDYSLQMPIAFYLDSIISAAKGIGGVRKAPLRGSYFIHKGVLKARTFGCGVSKLDETENINIDTFLHNPTAKAGGLVAIHA